MADCRRLHSKIPRALLAGIINQMKESQEVQDRSLAILNQGMALFGPEVWTFRYHDLVIESIAINGEIYIKIYEII